VRAFVLVTLASILVCHVIWAQATAQIHGTIQDSSGAAVGGAEVKAVDTDTGVERTAISASDGGYVLSTLPLGPYRIEVSKEGFTKAVESGIVLQVNSDPAVDIALKLGAVTEQVQVEANAALVETRSSGVGSVVETQRIIDLPLNGRNVTDLITLGGAAVQNGVSDTRLFSGRPYLSIGGMVTLPLGGGPTDWIYDGASHYDFMSGTSLPLAFPDAVQEFKVETSGLEAAHGNSSAVEIVTRSGSNALHGDLFEFIRNDAFGSAHEYFGTGASTYKRNQFGGVIGGPIVKNKLFFFSGFQGTTQRASPGNTIAFVPTEAMLSGDFTQFESSGCGRSAPLRGPFSGNKIDPNLLSPPAVYISNQLLAGLTKDGITPSPCGQIIYNTPIYENDYQHVAKIDYQINTKHSVFFRELWTRQFQPTLYNLDPNLLLAAQVGFVTPAYAFTVGDTYLLSSNVVNSFRIAFTRINETRPKDDFFNYCTAGVINLWCGENKAQFGMLTVVGGFSDGINTTDPPPDGGGGYYRSANYVLNDDVSWVRGSHQMTFGGSAWQGRVTSRNDFASNAQFTFSGAVTGQGLADFLTGNASNFVDGLPNGEWMQETFLNLYFADTWRITPRVTLNAGLRWEPYLPLGVPTGVIYDFSAARFVENIKSTVYVNAPPGFYYPGDPGFPDKSGINKQWRKFAPRLGVAWDPSGNGKMSIRSSYSFGYAFVPGLTREDNQGSNPWGGRETIAGVTTNFANPWGTSANNPFPYTVTRDAKFTPGGLYETASYNQPPPSFSTWNLSIQRQIGSSWLVSATYMGSHVEHLLINVPLNYAALIPGAPIVTSGCAPTALNCNAAANATVRRVLNRLNPAGAGPIVAGLGTYFGPTMQWNAGGNQHYHGLLLSLQRRLSQGVALGANWTWSHCIGQLLGYNTKADQTITDPNNINEVGNCDADRRHIVNITAVVDTPRFSNHALSVVASGWKLSGIYKFTSGIPLMIQDGTDQELSTINHQQPNLLDPNNVYTGHSGPGAFYINKAAFAPQPLGTVGSLGWNSLVGPSYWDIDLALSRQFRITERHRVELRADAFNLPNSFQPIAIPTTGLAGTTGSTGTQFGAPPTGPPFATLNNAQFGQILAAQATRKIQFALKYVF
jgi:Carboxypeptidase regulatory-like domain